MVVSVWSRFFAHPVDLRPYACRQSDGEAARIGGFEHWNVQTTD